MEHMQLAHISIMQNLYYPKKSLKSEKERFGKTFLVFPSHSIESLVTDFKLEPFQMKLTQYPKIFTL